MARISIFECSNGIVRDIHSLWDIRYPYNERVEGVILDTDSAETLCEMWKRPQSKLFKDIPFVITNDVDEGWSMINSALALGISGKVTYKYIEENLLLDEGGYSMGLINVYSCKYMTPEVMKEYTKPYGSTINLAKANIVHNTVRKDKRSFGLKYAKPGIYKDLIYFDFHNFYPNLLLEYGVPSRMDYHKWMRLVTFGNCKFTMNKIIGRFDQDYSIYYDPDYSNNIRKFGRLKLMYYISNCEELILCNTDSILAKVSEDFTLPYEVSKIDVSNALIKNIGNYVLIDTKNDEYRTTGIFNKPEEFVIAKERMGLKPSDDEFKISNLFNTDEEGFISADITPIESLDRKCRYGKSNRLSRKQLVSIQENI